MVAPPLAPAAAPKLVRPDYKALAGMCEVKFNNAKGGKGPKLLDCFLGMAVSESTVRQRCALVGCRVCQGLRNGGMRAKLNGKEASQCFCSCASRDIL